MQWHAAPSLPTSVQGNEVDPHEVPISKTRPYKRKKPAKKVRVNEYTFLSSVFVIVLLFKTVSRIRMNLLQLMRKYYDVN